MTGAHERCPLHDERRALRALAVVGAHHRFAATGIVTQGDGTAGVWMCRTQRVEPSRVSRDNSWCVYLRAIDAGRSVARAVDAVVVDIDRVVNVGRRADQHDGSREHGPETAK